MNPISFPLCNLLISPLFSLCLPYPHPSLPSLFFPPIVTAVWSGAALLAPTVGSRAESPRWNWIGTLDSPGLRMAVWSQVKVCGRRLSLRPIGCTPTLSVTQKRRCVMRLVGLYKCYIPLPSAATYAHTPLWLRVEHLGLMKASARGGRVIGHP